jgi:aminoglycoside phosphotransferase (APT) family kinase protein
MPDLSEILVRVQDRLGPISAGPDPLDGGITNRNFRAVLGGRDYVVRLPGKDTDLLGIDRTAERLAARQAASIGIAPELVWADEDCSVTVFAVDATPAEPDRLRADPAPFGRALRAFHDSGLKLPTQFWIPELLAGYAGLFDARGATPPAAFARTRELVARIALAVPLNQPVACHNDLLPGNLLVDGDRVLLVDWEYAGMGHRMFDLANLAVNNEFDDGAESRLLEAYYDERPPLPAHRAALRLMKIVSDAREAAWGVVQGLISELDFDFAAYAAKHFERLGRAAADPRLEDDLNAASA